MYLYMYIYIYMCVCVCACACRRARQTGHAVAVLLPTHLRRRTTRKRMSSNSSNRPTTTPAISPPSAPSLSPDLLASRATCSVTQGVLGSLSWSDVPGAQAKLAHEPTEPRELDEW